MNNKIYAEVWIRVADNGAFECREWRQFFCKDKDDVIDKVTRWLDKAAEIKVVPT